MGSEGATRRSRTVREKLADIWDWIVSPPASVQDMERRHHSRLLSSMLAILIPLALLIVLIPPLVRPDQAVWQDEEVLILVGSFLFWGAAFALSRSGRYEAAARLAVILALAALAAFIVSDKELEDIGYVLMPVLLSSLLLSLRFTASIIVLILIGLLFLPLIWPGLDLTGILVGPFSFVAIGSVLILTAARHRDRLEKARRSELGRSNEMLHQEIADHRQAREALAQQTQGLTRSNAFITALSQVAARLTIMPDSDQILQSLGSELKGIGLECMVALLDSDGMLVFRYISFDSAIMKLGEKLLGRSAIGYRFPLDRWPAEIFEQKQPLFVSEPGSMMAEALPWVPQAVLRRVLRLGGISPGDSVVFVPLMVEDRILGGMTVSGSNLYQEEGPALMTFADQVAIALENARLHAAERRHAERLEASLREKEMLLKEIHHRVKNNLQVISSLLHLQSEQIQDAQTLHALAESRNRVRSMALVHERLYQSPSLARIDFGEYVRSLTAYLLRSYGIGAAALQVDVRDVALGIDLAVPCGLIINELVSNALKHAFVDRQTGEIRVAFESDGKDYALTVSDNGVGLPEDAALQRAGTLGLQLVAMLVEQLGGTLEVERQVGTSFVVTFAA